MAKKRKSAFSAAEKRSYKRGLLKGLRARKRSNPNSDYAVAQRYAKHMGAKFGLSASQIRANANAHLRDMKKNPAFRRELHEDYDLK